MKTNTKYILISALALFFFISDRIFKYLVLSEKIFGVRNYDFALSIKLPQTLKVFLCFCVFVFLCILVFLLIKSIKQKNFLLVTGYSLLITGSFSNFLDRLKFNFIIDYINFYFFYNNLADLMIWVGAGLVVWGLVKNNKKK